MSGFGRGGGRGGTMKRGGSRGGGTNGDRRFTRPMDRPARTGPSLGPFENTRSPDISDHEQDKAPARFNNYRHSRRFTPSPDIPNRVNRSPSPPRIQYNESGRSGARDDGNNKRRNNVDQIVAKSESVPAHADQQKSEDQEAREWKVKLFDADEECRRADYQLRRAKMVRENLCEEYKEFLERCVNSEANNTPNW